MNQEAGDPLPCPVPSPGSVGMLGRRESPGPVPLTKAATIFIVVTDRIGIYNTDSDFDFETDSDSDEVF